MGSPHPMWHSCDLLCGEQPRLSRFPVAQTHGRSGGQAASVPDWMSWGAIFLVPCPWCFSARGWIRSKGMCLVQALPVGTPHLVPQPLQVFPVLGWSARLGGGSGQLMSPWTRAQAALHSSAGTPGQGSLEPWVWPALQLAAVVTSLPFLVPHAVEGRTLSSCLQPWAFSLDCLGVVCGPHQKRWWAEGLHSDLRFLRPDGHSQLDGHTAVMIRAWVK